MTSSARTLFSGIALSLLLLPASVSAQNEYEQQVLDILSEMSGFAMDQGYRQTGDKFVAALNIEEGETQYLDFVGGKDYLIVAVCDVDCSDIDLHLYSPDDEMVASDALPDDSPVLEVGNVDGGRHRLEIGMFACSSQPCYYAVGVYVKDGSGEGTQYSEGGGDAYIDQVLEMLYAWSDGVAGEGYTATGEEWVSALGSGETEDQSVTLGGGADYVILAVCDEDCGDMDMAIYDPSGNMVDEDVEGDANPVLEISSARKGEYRIEVRMYQCSNEPCYYAMGLFKHSGEQWVPVEVPLKRR